MYHTEIRDTEVIQLRPRHQTNHLASTYVRDEITLLPEQLQLTIGVRLDHNDFTGLEVQPNARLIWTPNVHKFITQYGHRYHARFVFLHGLKMTFCSLPGRLMEYLARPTQLPFSVLAQIHGTSSLNSEKLIAYELGYRHQFTPQASVDIPYSSMIIASCETFSPVFRHSTQH